MRRVWTVVAGLGRSINGSHDLALHKTPLNNHLATIQLIQLVGVIDISDISFEYSDVRNYYYKLYILFKMWQIAHNYICY